MKENKIETTSITTDSNNFTFWQLLKYLLAGSWFGILITKAEVISWFRIQEMFRLESFHMYGVIGSAIVVGALSVYIIKKANIKTIHGDPIHIQPKIFKKGQIYGGFIFGLGWAMTGACPGPLYANFGYGYSVFIIAIISAIAGTFIYGLLRDKLPN